MLAQAGGPLGCTPSYQVVIADRCRSGGDGIVRAEMTDQIASLSFNRTLNGISSASVSLKPGCCEELGQARQGRELMIFRNSGLAWRGEMLDDPRDCRSSATITAFDRWGIFNRRLIHRNLCFRTKCAGQSPQPPLTIAKALIDDGLAGDDRCQDVLYLGGCDAPIERDYGRYSDYTIEALDDLARSHIDYTTHGDRQIVMCKGYSLGLTARLTCEHFASDVCGGSGGLGSATKVVVVGDGVFGEAGGVDDYYGLLETRIEDDSIKTVAAANAEAAAQLRALRPPVWWVDAPNGSQLTDKAPVSLEELVPGVLVPVELDCACTPLSEVMRLTDVNVTYSGSEGERVGITLTSINRVGDGTPVVESFEEGDEGG